MGALTCEDVRRLHLSVVAVSDRQNLFLTAGCRTLSHADRMPKIIGLGRSVAVSRPRFTGPSQARSGHAPCLACIDLRDGAFDPLHGSADV
jgi:hypothetical protein